MKPGWNEPSALRVSLDVSAVPPSPAGAGRYIIDLAAALARRPEAALTLVARRRDGPRWLRRALDPRSLPEKAADPGEQGLVEGAGQSVRQRVLRQLLLGWSEGR